MKNNVLSYFGHVKRNEKQRSLLLNIQGKVNRKRRAETNYWLRIWGNTLNTALHCWSKLPYPNLG